MNFILQPNSLFTRHLHWTRGVTLNPCKRRWTTTWTWMNPDCNWDDLFRVKSTSNFLQCIEVGSSMVKSTSNFLQCIEVGGRGVELWLYTKTFFFWGGTTIINSQKMSPLKHWNIYPWMLHFLLVSQAVWPQESKSWPFVVTNVYMPTWTLEKVPTLEKTRG